MQVSQDTQLVLKLFLDMKLHSFEDTAINTQQYTSELIWQVLAVYDRRLK